MKNKKSISALAAFLTSIQLLSAQAIKPVSYELEKNFVNPPDSAKPSCYWWWLNANVDKEAITRDMDQFRAKGLTDDPLCFWSGDTLINLTKLEALKITLRTIESAHYLFIESGGFGTKNPAGWKPSLVVMKMSGEKK